MLRGLPLQVLLVLAMASLAVLPARAGLIQLEAYGFDTALGEPDLPPALRLQPEEYADYGYFLVQAGGPV
ncbi:MAG: hypothetical protein GF330_14485, partial [Candidatus Eisenbacteria bacterium]|nr:hypothetical protein [Candidatus Eisenbacteria bacterium]